MRQAIRYLGDPILRRETTPVTAGMDIGDLVKDLFDTLYTAKGLGLAAPQIGRTERVAVVDVQRQPIVLVNPKIITASNRLVTQQEGCLSIPGVFAEVARPDQIVVGALDRDATPFTLEASGELAQCIQHEIDHLDGKLFIDYLSTIKRQKAMTTWKRMRVA